MKQALTLHVRIRLQRISLGIIFLTAMDKDQHYSYRGYAAGGADYISKPFDPWVLRAKVSVFLDLYRKNRQLEHLLSREHIQSKQLSTRLAALADQLSDDTAPDLTDLRARVHEIRRLVG